MAGSGYLGATGALICCDREGDVYRSVSIASVVDWNLIGDERVGGGYEGSFTVWGGRRVPE